MVSRGIKTPTLLVLIPNYRTHQVEYLYKVLEEYSKYTQIAPTVVLLSTDATKNLEKYNYPVEEQVFDHRIGVKLSEIPRQMSNSYLDKFDYYMHQENDTLVTEENILSFIEGQTRLDEEYGKNKYIHGFLRYENTEKGYLIDNHKNYGVAEVLGTFIKPHNVHQGGWIVTNSQLHFLSKNEIPYGNTLEDYCSNFYYSKSWPGTLKGIPKLIYRDLLKTSVIHHLPDKYSKHDNNFLTIKDLI